jgi:hypothetical protein
MVHPQISERWELPPAVTARAQAQFCAETRRGNLPGDTDRMTPTGVYSRKVSHD